MEKTYKNAINLLTSQGKFYINLGLERISAVLKLMDNPQNELSCIHVAGTNGKGSVCAILSAILTENGYKTGLFTSPHIFEYTERIKIDNVEISKEVFAEKIFKIQELSENNDIHLTEFEILTAIAFEYFKEQKVDVVVLETGLGGRFDATNVIEKPLVSVITTIDFDHTERLGDTIEKIAFEKAGIVKEGCPVLISPTNKGYNTIKEVAGERLFNAINFNLGEMSLKGIHQQENMSLAISALNMLIPNVKLTTIQSALKKVKHPFRFEYFEEKNLIIDGAHNPNGIAALRQNLDVYFKDKKFRFVFGCLKNKDYKTMIELLFKEGDEIFFYKFDNPNSASFEELRVVCKFPCKELEEKLPSSERLTIVCGSLYMISEIFDKL